MKIEQIRRWQALSLLDSRQFLITHIGLVSDRQVAGATPLVIHNIGSSVKEEDILFRFKVIGPYRPVFGSQSNDAPRAARASSGGRK